MLELKFSSRRVYAIAFSPDGRLLASGHTDHVIWMWDAAKGTTRDCGICKTNREHILAFSPNGKLLLTAGDGIQFFRVSPTGHLKPFDPLTYWDHRVTGVAFTADSKHMFFADTYRDMAALAGYDTATLDAVGHDDCTDVDDPSGPVAVAADGTLATGLRSIRIWNLDDWLRAVKRRRKSYDPRQRLNPRTNVKPMAFSPKSRALACVTGKVVCLWDVATAQEIRKLVGHTGPISSVAWHPAGRILATSSHDGTVRFWEGSSGQERAAFEWSLGKVQCVVFAPDGMRAAACGDNGRIVIWDVELE